MIPRTEWLIRLSLIAALSALLHASPADTTGNLDGFYAFMAKAMQDFKVPGAAVAVIKDGKILLVKSYGYRDTGKKLPITGKTLFPIASITKSLTVTALGTLVEPRFACEAVQTACGALICGGVDTTSCELDDGDRFVKVLDDVGAEFSMSFTSISDTAALIAGGFIGDEGDVSDQARVISLR